MSLVQRLARFARRNRCFNSPTERRANLFYVRRNGHTVAAFDESASRQQQRYLRNSWSRIGSKGFRSMREETPSAISSASASPVAGPLRMPQTLCPVAT